MWHMSNVTSEVFFSFVFSFVFLDNMWELVGGGSDINGAYRFFLPDPIGAGLHLAFQFSYIHTNGLTDGHSSP